MVNLGLSPGMFVSPHSIAYDSYGNIYVGDVVETDWAHLFGNKVKPIDIRRFQRFYKNWDVERIYKTTKLK